MDATMMDVMSDEMMAMPGTSGMDMAMMQACMDACAACEQACTVCAAQEMSCATACMNCADMCHTAMRSMLRMSGMTPMTMTAMMDACIAMCEMCMDECMEHRGDAVCMMCAQSCQACIEACAAVREAMAA